MICAYHESQWYILRILDYIVKRRSIFACSQINSVLGGGSMQSGDGLRVFRSTLGSHIFCFKVVSHWRELFVWTVCAIRSPFIHSFVWYGTLLGRQFLPPDAVLARYVPCLRLCPSVSQKSEFYWNGWTNQSGFWHRRFVSPILHYFIRCSLEQNTLRHRRLY